MKPFVSTLASLAIAIFAVGCGGAEVDNSDVDNVQETEEMLHAEPAPDPSQSPAEGEGEAPAEGEGEAPAE